MGYIQGVNAVKQAKRRVGAPYVYGAERVKGDDPTLPIDCSELVQIAFAEVGLTIVDGSVNQWRECIPCSKELARNIPGALCFWRKNSFSSISHVAISTGQGNIIEATPPKVRVASIDDRKWSCFGLPKCIYG